MWCTPEVIRPICETCHLLGVWAWFGELEAAESQQQVGQSFPPAMAEGRLY
jgi:hypothetical protein